MMALAGGKKEGVLSFLSLGLRSIWFYKIMGSTTVGENCQGVFRVDLFKTLYELHT
jgi:hypothetical protein